MDGRDIGTCVLPDADVKIFLTADSAVRARRRFEELAAKGTPEPLEKIEKDIIERDARDRNREISPLKQAEDAVLVDTSEMTIDEVVEAILEICRKKDAYNMEVILAESAGFCFGVKRAVDKVYEQIETGKKIYTYGPIIHNEFVVQDLEKKGVEVIESEEALEQLTEGTIVIRSHGVPKSICEKIEKQGLECVDATCPFVKRIHKIVEKESAAGRQIVIIGNAGHPEVEGIQAGRSLRR